MRLPAPDRIANAVQKIDSIFLNTPAYRPDDICSILQTDIVFKDERVTPIGSFKGRGADLLVRTYPAGSKFICASAGNFGQGMAWSVRRNGGELIVYAASTAVQRKIDAMRAMGANVILEGRDFDEAKLAAKDYARTSGKLFVEDGAQVEIAEGAGTIALELTETEEDFDAFFIPLGNGSLAAGMGCWVKHVSPSTKIFAVAAERAPAMGLAVLGQPYADQRCDTIADGIAIRVPVPAAVEAVAAIADEVLFVSDQLIETAMDIIERATNREVEPAGAAGLAGLLSMGDWGKGKRVAIPICGGNRNR